MSLFRSFATRGRPWMPHLTVLAISLLALLPFLQNPSLPAGTDAELHIFRLVELSRLVRAGILYPRWAPDFYFGYGYPIFNYYAPLAYYAGLALDLLPAIGPVAAVKGIFIFSILLGGWGMFGFVRDIWGDRAGTVAAAAYLYAPYLQYIDPLARGVLAESLAMGLLPCGLWALARLWRRPSRPAFIAASLVTAAALLAHNLMAMIFGGLIGGWLVWVLLFEQVEGRRPGRLLLAFALGIGLTAFFWLPVGLERQAVNLSTLVGERGSHFSYDSHFLSPAELLAPSLWLDWGATEPAYRFNLGPAQWILGALGLLLLAAQRLPIAPAWPGNAAARWSQPLFFGLSALGLIGLMLPLSDAVWSAVPLLPFLQFPWRLLGPAAACLAVLAGFAAGRLPAWLPAFPRPDLWMVLLILALAVPLSQVPPWEPFGPADVAALTYQETRGRWLGTTSTADFVPVTVDSIPQGQGQLIDTLLRNGEPDRVNRAALPADVQVISEPVNPLHTRYTVEAPAAFPLRLFLFDFPGWQVTIDGQPAATELGRPEGFLVVPVPAGSHTVDVRFGSTPARRAGWLITAFSLLALLALAWRWPRSDTPAEALPALDGSTAAAALLVAALALLLPHGWFHYDSDSWLPEPAAEKRQDNFDNQIILTGLDLSGREIRAGETIEVTLYWQAASEQTINFQSFVHLLGPDGIPVAQDDKLNPGDFPTRRWPLDKYVLDRYKLTLPAELPPGRYRLTAGLWVQAEGWRLPVLDASGRQLGDRALLAEIEVRP